MGQPYFFELKYDQEDRIIEKTETVSGKTVKWKYSYDKAGRLVEADLDSRLICQCHYDKEGRRMQDYFPATAGNYYREYRYTFENRLQSAGGNTYTHDKSGFRSIWSFGGRYTLYKYAPDYRLLKMEVEGENHVFEFSHDDNGQREAKFFNGQMVEAYKWLDFIRLAGFHDGQNLFEFAYEDEVRTPYAMRRDDGAVAYLFYDHIGSLRVVADMDGNVIKEVLYDPFGGIIEDTNPDLSIPIGFAGGLHNRDLGFVRFGWRDYDTLTSRWTAPDPLGDAGGDDWYGYCLDDPVNGVDPLGLFGEFGPGYDGTSGSGYSGVGGNSTISSGGGVSGNSYQGGSTRDDGRDSLDELSGLPGLQYKIDRGLIGGGGVPSGYDGSGSNNGPKTNSQWAVQGLRTREKRVKTSVQKTQKEKQRRAARLAAGRSAAGRTNY